jgi:hypothetical protein
MPLENTTAKLDEMDIKKGSIHFMIAKLIRNGFFDTPRRTTEVIEKNKSISGKKLKSNIIQTYMKKFMQNDILASFTIEGEKGNYWYSASLGEEKARKMLGLTLNEQKISEQLFSDNLFDKLNSRFSIEISDLHLVFGKSGTCTAFLLRKILEKLIFLAFANNGMESKLESNGELMGLKTMIDVATKTKVNGVPFLLPKTGREVSGIKFLGDSSAHNPLVNVDMKTIIPQMPYIITAYEELSYKL